MNEEIMNRIHELINELKATCAAKGLGNDGNEYKVITQVFQYKFLSDKFLKEMGTRLGVPEGKSVYDALIALPDDEYARHLRCLPSGVAKFQKNQLVQSLHNKQNVVGFDILFDQTLSDIAAKNAAIFSVKTATHETVQMFDKSLSSYIEQTSERADFCRAIISKLSMYSFESVVGRGYDFFSEIYEYLIKDYNSDSGGKYAEYFTPHSVGRVMSDILVDGEPKGVTCYDPSAGSGTLLMCLASRIGASRCTIYSQDISQKSSGLLRLNLVLNDLVKSLQNVVQGNTLTNPAFSAPNGGLMQFDYIVSNPPFNLDFSDFHSKLTATERQGIYFAGVPNIPAKKKSSMAIYQCFIQHVIASLSAKGKAAIVVPSGFLTARSTNDKIAYGIRQMLIDKKWIRGVVSMPSNIFGKTNTSVSVLFIDKAGAEKRQGAILIDATTLGKDKQVDGKKRHVLSGDDEKRIIDTFKKHIAVEGFAVVPNYDDIAAKGYSLSAGLYFDVKVEYSPISNADFSSRIEKFCSTFSQMSKKSAALEAEIQNQMKKLRYE